MSIVYIIKKDRDKRPGPWMPECRAHHICLAHRVDGIGTPESIELRHGPKSQKAVPDRPDTGPAPLHATAAPQYTSMLGLSRLTIHEVASTPK